MVSKDRFIPKGRKKSRRASAYTARRSRMRGNDNDNGSSQQLQDITSRRRTGYWWTTTSTKARIIYVTIAIAVGILGISLIIYGATKQRMYNDNAADQEYYDTNDFFELDGQEIDVTAPSSSGSGIGDGTPPEGLTPTATSTIGHEDDDDELLILIKRAYYDALEGIPNSFDIVDRHTNILLNVQTQATKDKSFQSSQFKAYLELLNDRTDIIDKNTNTILMKDTNRILQIYALSVFYDTYNWPKEGTNECLWSGITCAGLGVYENLKPNTTPAEVEDATLHVVSLNVNGDDNNDNGKNAYGPILEGNNGLPIELIFLRHLETLDVSHNLIRGMLWGGMLLHWKNIKVLALNDNRFVSIHSCFLFVLRNHLCILQICLVVQYEFIIPHLLRG